MSDFVVRFPRIYGAVSVVAAAAFLVWEWFRDRGPGPWWPGHGQVLAIICAPVFILVGLALVRQGPRAVSGRGLDSRPYFAIGLALGVLNAYLLGVWDSLTRYAAREVWESWWWAFLVAFLLAAFFTRRALQGDGDRGSDGG